MSRESLRLAHHEVQVLKREEGRKPGRAAQGEPPTLKTRVPASCVPGGRGRCEDDYGRGLCVGIPVRTLNPHCASESPAKPFQGDMYLALL